MNCVICGNFRSGAKTLNLSSVGAQTICHILEIKEPERTRAVSNLQGCKICEECSENIKAVYLTLHQASKVSVEIDEWRLKFFQKLGSDSKPESEAKKEKLARSSLKVRNRHELTKKVRNHIRRELRIDKKAEKITSLRMLDPTKNLTQSIQPLVQSSRRPQASFVPITNYSAASDGSTLEGLEYHIGAQDGEMNELSGEVGADSPQPLQSGEDQQQQQLTLGFYTEREMEEELVENANTATQDEVNGYTLRIMDRDAPLGTLERRPKKTDSVNENEELKKLADLYAENTRNLDGMMEQLYKVRKDVAVPTIESKKCPSPSRRKQTIKLSCYDFKRPKEASDAASSTTEHMEHGSLPSTSHSITQATPAVRAPRSSSSTSKDRQSEMSATRTSVQQVLQGTPKHVYGSKRKSGHQVSGGSHLLPKLRFGESIAVDENDEIQESAAETGDQGTKSRRGEIVDIISYKSIMNGNDDDEDDDDEDYCDDYETAYSEQGQQLESNAEVEAANSDAKEALERLAALGQCDIEHITMDLCDESDFGLSSSDFELALQGYGSVAMKDAPFDIVNVESPNINCEESNDADGVITVEGVDRALFKV